MLSWVITSPSKRAASSFNPRAAGSVAIRRSLAMASNSSTSGRPGFLRDRIEQAVDEAAFALVVEGVGNVDIFGNDRTDRDVAAGEQLIGSGTKDCAHRPVEAFESPALGQPRGDGPVDVGAARIHPSHDVIEKVPLRVMILRILDHPAEPVIMEFLDQAGQRRAFHLVLVQRLDRSEARRGTREGPGLAHSAGAVALA